MWPQSARPHKEKPTSLFNRFSGLRDNGITLQDLIRQGVLKENDTIVLNLAPLRQKWLWPEGSRWEPRTPSGC